MSNNITKQSIPSKTVAKNRSEKSKIVTKSSSTTNAAHVKSKNDTILTTVAAAASTTATKRRIAKDNGVQHSLDETKKSEKKHTATTNSKQKIPNDKQRETKTKLDGKILATNQTTKSTEKKVLAGEKVNQKRSSDKIKSNSSKESNSKSVSRESQKSTIPKEATKDTISSKESSKVVKPKTELSTIKQETESKMKKGPLKASHAIGGSKSIGEAATIATASVTAAAAKAATAATAAALTSKNVMNQVHNVTVQSPPPQRREFVQTDEIDLSEPHNESMLEQRRGRTRTRTLEAAEIVFLKPNESSTELTTVITNTKLPNTNQGLAPTTTQIEAAPTLNTGTDTVRMEIKPAVSFEVMLNDKDNKKDPIKNEQPKQIPVSNVMDTKMYTTSNDIMSANESDNYEDDFDSYESDFETDSSNENGEGDEEDEEDASDSDEQTGNETSNISMGESDTDDENIVSTASKHPFETGYSIENSEFDSGSFEMKVLSARSRIQHKSERNNVTTTASEATRVAAATAALHSEHQNEIQNDSGIENCSKIATHNGQMNSFDANNKTFDNISDIEIEGAAISLDTISNAATNKTMAANKQMIETKPKSKSRLARRGEELLSKITLDIMNYVLCDFKPIPYELFMKIYGNCNTAQVAVQTHNDRIDQECQCDTIAMQSSWSQYPITYYNEHMLRSDFHDYKNGYGTETANMATITSSDTSNNTDNNNTDANLNRTYQNSLSLFRRMAVQTNVTTEKSRDDTETLGKLNIDYGHLNRFLLESEVTLARILNIHNVKRCFRNLNESPIPISNGYLTLKPSFATSNFTATSVKIERTFASDALPGFLFTLHLDSDSKLNVLALWHLSKLSEPVCLLSVWSKILCVEIHPKIRDIVFAGLDDGSIAVWDYSESKYWHPNLSDTIKRFVPSQITTPTFNHHAESSDFGRCVAIRSLPIATDTDLLNGYNPIQMCSLHECGLLILWTVLCNTTNTHTDLMNKRIEHQSLWSKVKLIQNKVIDLSASVRQMFQLKRVRPTSKSFDKTRSYFESELFNDIALQELHRMNAADEEKLLTTFRCTAIELTHDGILISTNENFLLLGRKSFKNESFRRIQIDSCKNVRVECMLSLIGFGDDIVVIVLNNGAVKSLCCDLSDEIDDFLANSDTDEASSTGSSLSPTAVGGGSGAAAADPDANAKASTAYALPVDSIVFAVAPASSGPVQTMTAMAAPHHGNIDGYLTDGNSLGKSCTIQSLVLNERKIYDEHQSTLNHLENIEYNKASAATIETVPIKSMQQKSIRCTQLLNGQTLFNNTMDLFSVSPPVSHQNLVQLIKSNKLIILRKNRLRIYDLIANHMIEMPSKRQNRKYIDATTTTADHNEEYLVLLNSEGIIELHQIKI